VFFSELIKGELRPSIYRVPYGLSDEPLEQLATTTFSRSLDDAIRDKQTLFADLARLFDFPDYFGKNWDALTDCLSDLNWLDPQPQRIVLIWKQPLALYDASTEDFLTALRVLNAVIDRWWSRNVMFHALLEDPIQALPLSGLPLLFVDRAI
jgi:RNAse (barnase) inhibitor barstar